ncbi:MAG: DUF4215 domain-containing protein [Candidatus Komeilibacteria bacterium]
MKRKIITIMTVMAFIFTLMPQSYVSAQTIDQCEQVLASGQPELSTWEDDAGATPANNFYFMDKLGDWIKLRLFSFTKDARINTLLDQAQERVGELERLQRQNNLKPSYVNRIVDSYNNIMAEVSTRLSNMQGDGVDMTDIISRVTILSAKNKTIIAGILSKVSAQNYNTIQSAYNQSGTAFCEVVDSWVSRENQCNDTILLTQESSNSFNNIAGEIANVGETSSSIESSFEQVSSYLDRVENISVDINNSKEDFSGAVSSSSLSLSDKEQVLNDKLDDFRGDYFYLLNNQPQVDTAIRSIISYRLNDNPRSLVARARASAALMDVALNNAEVGADIAYIENIMSVNLSEDKDLNDLLDNLKSAKESSLQTEINTLSSLVSSQQDEIEALEESKNVCRSLKNDFSEILDRLDTGRFSQARNGVLALQAEASNLNSTYLPACGMMPVIDTLYDILINGNALDPNNSCSSQSYIDNYVAEIVAWGEDRLALWDTMLDQHDGIVDELNSQLDSYEMISVNKGSVATSLDSHFSSYANVNAAQVSSAELDSIQTEIGDLERRLNSAESDVVDYEGYKNNANASLQVANSSYVEAQTAVSKAESELQTADTNVKQAQAAADQARADYLKIEQSLNELNTIKNSTLSELNAAKDSLDALNTEKVDLEKQIDTLKVSLNNNFSIASINQDNFQLEEEILLDLSEDINFDRSAVELEALDAELKNLNEDIVLKSAEVDQLQSNYDKVLADYNSTLTEYNNKEDDVVQADFGVYATTQVYTQKESAYNSAVSGLNTISNNLNSLQASYDAAVSDYTEAVVLRDIISSDLDNKNNEYNNAVAKAVKLEVIRQELDSFITDKFDSTVSNYRTSVDSLGVLNNDWKTVAFEYNEIADNIADLRTTMNGTNLANIRTELNSMKTLAGNLETMVEYNMPAQQISNQLDTIDRLVSMRMLGQARIDNIKASVQTSVVNLQNITCSEAQPLYNQGITDICNNFSIGDYLNTCDVINNLEIQIVDTCQLQPVNNCGNTIVDDGEQCDDGNKLSGDGCSALCQSEITSYCGDGRIQRPNSFGVNEECENVPANNEDGDGCSSQCTNEVQAVCGDGILQQPNSNGFSEQCDDGNRFAGDGCNNLCQLERGSQKTINIRRTIP